MRDAELRELLKAPWQELARSRARTVTQASDSRVLILTLLLTAFWYVQVEGHGDSTERGSDTSLECSEPSQLALRSYAGQSRK